jgi:hypothetical protein
MPLNNNTFPKISELLKLLYNETDKLKSLEYAIDLANQFILVLDDSIELKSSADILIDNTTVHFQNQKIETWFNKHPHYPQDKFAIVHFDGQDRLFESKFYWLNETSTKARISAGVMLTPNWEDNDSTRYSKNYKVGIDFFFTNDLKSLLVVLSNNGNVRVLELSHYLKNTQIDILNSIYGVGKEQSQEVIHQILWNSFALKEVNKKFFEAVAELFTELFNFLSKTKDKQDSKMFANRLIGRLLFIWFLRKKDLINESENYFEVEADSTNYYQNKLKPLFFETLNTQIQDRKTTDKTTPYLNGGLFDTHVNDWFEETINFPQGWFQRLYNHFNDFNFTTDESTPEYEQVAIDPEMLGKVLENLLATLDADTGESARKAKGAYYTPREIVSYMCKESVRQYLYKEVGNSAYNEGIDKLLDESDAKYETAHTNAKRDLWGVQNEKIISTKILTAIDKLKVLDPACGSGAFPIGMLQVLLKIYERLEPRFDQYKTKLGILKNNIYGSDIEPMASEISRLRAWLSLVVDSPKNKEVEPLPNLDFKFVCANSLVSLETDSDNSLFEIQIENELTETRNIYFLEHNKEKKKILQNKMLSLAKQLAPTESDKYTTRIKQLKSINLLDTTQSALCFDSFWHFGIKNNEDNKDKGCFHIIIGNPPYVSNKGVSEKAKEEYKKNYKMSDDLYNYFFIKGIELLKDNGTLAYITSDTFLTINSKLNIRQLFQNNKVLEIIKTDNVFEGVLVSPAISIIKKQDTKNIKYEFTFKDANTDFNNPIKKVVNIDIYRKANNNVFFFPSENNLKFYNKYNDKIKELYTKWWDKIKTSKAIEDNKKELEEYRKSLKPGDITLLGCLTDGGVGLQTGNNGKYIAVRKSTKWASKIIESRSKKLKDAIDKYNITKLKNIDTKEYLSKLSEQEIADLFDSLKKKYGRDIFGQGYIYKIIEDSDIADVEKLTGDEKENGIDTSKKYYVPYDKGDKDGNRWYLETPFAIAWSKENVHFLKSNSGKKGEGMPVVRNQQFYFKEGFCWSDIKTTFVKCRKKSKTVNDVKSMSLYHLTDKAPISYIVSIMNSSFVSYYIEDFLNNTQTFQINDARELPIIIPTREQIQYFSEIFNNAIKIKKQEFNKTISIDKCEEQLNIIQNQLDILVNKLYSV